MMLFRAEQFDLVADVAARSGAELADFRDAARAAMPAGSRYVDFRADTMFASIRRAHDASQSRRLIVRNLDLGLARLKVADRRRFWDAIVNNFPPNTNTAVVFVMPDEKTGMHLLPSSETTRMWSESNRIFRLESA